MEGEKGRRRGREGEGKGTGGEGVYRGEGKGFAGPMSNCFLCACTYTINVE